MPDATFVSAYIQYAKAHTSAPQLYHEFSALSICAAALGNRVWIEAGFGRCYPAMWIGLIGPTGVHKSAASGRASYLLRKANEELLLPQMFTWEALILRLRSQSFGFLHWSEMSHSLEAMSKEYSGGVMSFLVELWDSGYDVSRLTKGDGEVHVKYPSLSILAAGTPAFLKRYVKPHQVDGGFCGRFMFLVAHKNLGYLSIAGSNNGRADIEQRESLIAHLKTLTEYEEHEMVFGKGLPVLDKWLEENEGRWDEDTDPAGFSNRAGANVLKLSMAIQASWGVHFLRELHPQAVEEAIVLWSQAFDSGRALMRDIAGHSVDSEMLEKIIRVVRGAGRIRRRDVLLTLGILLKTLEGYTATLVASGRIKVELDPEHRSVWWYEWVG